MKIAMIQMNILEKNKTANVNRGFELLTQAASHANVLVLPELWTTGYSLGRIQEDSDNIDSHVVKCLANISKNCQVEIIAGSMPMKFDDKIFNTSLIFSPNGNIYGHYNKIHLFGMFNEQRFFTAGNKRLEMDIANIPSGVAICYDLRFPELFTAMAAKGAKIIYLPAEWPEARGENWRLLLQARALENQIFICAVNCAGTFKGQDFFGHSMLVGPDGKIIAEAGKNEEILYGEIDLNAITFEHSKMNTLSDRRPETYSNGCY